MAAAYRPRGVAPLPPALLAMVTVLQAYEDIGDAEAVVTAQVDQRWQLALGCLGASAAPFSQGALVKFRARMIAQDLDQKLLDGPWRSRSRQGDSAGRRCAPRSIPEHAALALLTPALAPYGPLAELLIDRGYLGSPDIAALDARGVAIRAKAWTSTKRGRFPKSAFAIHLAEARVTCPAQQTAPIVRGAATVHFAAAVCQPCSLRAACTTARGGRSVALHPQEALLQSLRARQQQPEGRTQLRQRTTVEHSLARVDHLQGPKARYKGLP